MKGKTEIILTNVETGEVEVHKDENLITGAIDKIINMEMAMNHQPNSRVLPIASKLLGGIMLFDDDLSEDNNNIHFPVEAHLVGYANQSVNTDDKYRGSFNSIESGKTENGFVSVWDFGTTQANGTIKAVARTHTHGAACPAYYFNGPDYEQTSSGNPNNDTNWHPIRYDGEYLYMLKGDSNTHMMRLARVLIPMFKFGVADYSDVQRSYEVIASWSTDVFTFTYYYNRGRPSETQYNATVYADDPVMYEDGQDGYIYCMTNGRQSSYDSDFNYDLCYFTINYGDGSYDKSETTNEITGTGSYSYNESYGRFPKRTYGHVHNGVYYKLSGDRKIIFKIPLSNVSSYSSFRIIGDNDSDYIDSFEQIISHNGALYFEVYHYTESSYEFRSGILYPDGVYIIVERSYAGTSNSHGGSYLYNRCRTCDDGLSVFGYYPANGTTVYRSWAANYLGTVNNLGSAITKTAAQTMKIVYTLTDIEDDSDSDGGDGGDGGGGGDS